MGPVIVTNTSSNGTTILNNPEGPSAIAPAGNNTGQAYAKLNDDCTLTVTDSTGKVTYSTNITSTGPCRLIISPNGTVSILDEGTNRTVWSNNATASCTPISLVMEANGVLTEKDCNNNTVWQAPSSIPPCE